MQHVGLVHGIAAGLVELGPSRAHMFEAANTDETILAPYRTLLELLSARDDRASKCSNAAMVVKGLEPALGHMYRGARVQHCTCPF